MSYPGEVRAAVICCLCTDNNAYRGITSHIFVDEQEFDRHVIVKE